MYYLLNADSFIMMPTTLPAAYVHFINKQVGVSCQDPTIDPFVNHIIKALEEGPSAQMNGFSLYNRLLARMC